MVGCASASSQPTIALDKVTIVVAPHAPQKSVVVIDDDPDVTFVICTVLDDDGYRVVCHTQASLALESVVADQPDLVILDWWLPESGGQALLSVLRENSRTAHVRSSCARRTPPSSTVVMSSRRMRRTSCSSRSSRTVCPKVGRMTGREFDR
jgi:CheY-like chemotaxis protein